MQAWSDHRRQQARLVVLPAAGFWLAYFILWSIRSALLFGDGGRLLLPRFAAATANMPLTIVLLAALLYLAARHLWLAIVAGTLLAAPCGVGYAVIDRIVFDPPAARTDTEQATRHHRRHGRHADRGQLVGDARGVGDDESAFTALLERATNGYCLYLCAALLEITLIYAQSARRLERRSAELRSAARLAEIRALRYQVNPHFLFNALNSLSALVLRKRTAEAETMIDNLASFYRNALSQDPTGDVPLREEIRLQQLYLAIELVRFPGRIRAELDVPPELEEAQVPGLILQPLVENAVKHGVAKSTASVTISIVARARQGRLFLRVSDDAGASQATEACDQTPGIGLANVVSRLAARYEQDAACHWFDLGGKAFVVDLNLPRTTAST